VARQKRAPLFEQQNSKKAAAEVRGAIQVPAVEAREH
jgi:hypothetical protein